MSLGQRLKSERNKKGWSQKYAADKLGITNTVLSNYERDYRDPDTDTLKRIAEVYETSIDYLLKGHEFGNKKDNIVVTLPEDSERDYHILDTHDVQFIARSNKDLSPEQFKKIQELAKKAAELFESRSKDK